MLDTVALTCQAHTDTAARGWWLRLAPGAFRCDRCEEGAIWCRVTAPERPATSSLPEGSGLQYPAT